MESIFVNRYGQVRSGWKIAAVLCIFLVLTLASSVSVGMVAGFASVIKLINMLDETDGDLFSIIDQVDYSGLMMVMGIVQAVSMIIAVWLGLRAFERKSIRDIGLDSIRKRWKDLVFGLILGALSMSMIFAALLAFGSVTAGRSGGTGLLSALGTSLVAYVMVALNEEIFGRGYCMTVLKQTRRLWVPFVVSSLIFMALHGLNPNISFLGMFNLFMAGILFAFMYYRTGSLWMPVGYHFTWNYFQGSVFGFPVSGLNNRGIFGVEIMEGNVLNGGAFGPEGGIIATLVIIGGMVTVWRYGENMGFFNVLRVGKGNN